MILANSSSVDETALGRDLQLHGHFLAHRLIADGACRHLRIL